MNRLKHIGKLTRKFAWAFVVAYMIALHNVYKEKSDMPASIEYHMENDHETDNGTSNLFY